MVGASGRRTAKAEERFSWWHYLLARWKGYQHEYTTLAPALYTWSRHAGDRFRDQPSGKRWDHAGGAIPGLCARGSPVTGSAPGTHPAIERLPGGRQVEGCHAA